MAYTRWLESVGPQQRTAQIGRCVLLHSALSLRQPAFDQRQAPDAICGPSSTPNSIRGFASYERGEEIYSGTYSSEYWYCVMSGAARKYALLRDGRRRVIDFLLPGNFFGFPTRHKEYFATDAIVPGTIIARYSFEILKKY
jgi:Cyclic nucleotide-binding domain